MKEYFKSSAKVLKLDIPFPYMEMLAEAQALRSKFVPHRDGESNGWYSLTIHGLGEDKTGSWADYGYTSGGEAGKDMKWTSVADLCPVTTSFLKHNFPSNQYGRVRFMLLEAGGYIGMHSDSSMPLIENINLVLNNPAGCIWTWGDGETFDMIPGSAYAMNVSYLHTITNNSNEDRYHMIVTRHDATKEWKELVSKACAEQDVNGEYIVLDALP